MSESTFGGDTGFEEEETSFSSDVRSGYDEDQPPVGAELRRGNGITIDFTGAPPLQRLPWRTRKRKR